MTGKSKPTLKLKVQLQCLQVMGEKQLMDLTLQLQSLASSLGRDLARTAPV